MAHFVSLDRYDRTRVLGKPWAMVTVELVARKRLQVQADSLRVAKADVEWHPLPPDFEVVGGEGARQAQSWTPVFRHRRDLQPVSWPVRGRALAVTVFFGMGQEISAPLEHFGSRSV